MTKNHDYNTPGQGTSNWHVPLNENFEQFDDDIEIRDEESNKGRYEPKAGAKFFATDTETVYLGDGSNWTEVKSSGRHSSFDAVDTRSLKVGRIDHQSDETTSVAPNNPRPLITTQDRTIYVDPSRGDDSVATDDITSRNPLKTLKEAVQRTPLFIQHDWIIDLADGTYSGGNELNHPVASFGTFGESGNAYPNYRIEGNQSNPGNVVVDYNWWGTAHRTPETDDAPSAVINSLTFHGAFQNKGGCMNVANVTFTGKNNDAGGHIGKGFGWTAYRNCEFQNDLKYAIEANSGERIVLYNCSGNVSKYAYTGWSGSMIIDASGNTVTGDKGRFKMNDGAMYVTQQGVPINTKVMVADDFGDGEWDGYRVGGNQGAIGYRPNSWYASSGSASVSGTTLQVPSRSAVGVNCPFSSGKYRWKWNFESAPSRGSLKIGFVRSSWNATWELQIQNGGRYTLRKYDGGYTDVISGRWPQDTATHTARAERTEAGDWSLYLDGGQIGSGTDTYLPGGGGYEMFITNDTDVQWNLESVRVERGA